MYSVILLKWQNTGDVTPTGHIILTLQEPHWSYLLIVVCLLRKEDAKINLSWLKYWCLTVTLKPLYHRKHVNLSQYTTFEYIFIVYLFLMYISIWVIYRWTPSFCTELSEIRLEIRGNKTLFLIKEHLPRQETERLCYMCQFWSFVSMIFQLDSETVPTEWYFILIILFRVFTDIKS